MNKPLMAFAGLIAAGGTVAGVYVAAPGGGEEEVVQHAETSAPTSTDTVSSDITSPTPTVTPPPTATLPTLPTIPPLPSGWSLYTDEAAGIARRPWPGSCLRSSPAAVSWGSIRIDLFYRGCDDAVFHQWYVPGAWARANLGGCTMLAPAVASWTSGRLDLLYRGCENGLAGGGLFTRSYNAGWGGEQFLGGCLASGPGSDAWAPEWLVAQYRGCDSPARMVQDVLQRQQLGGVVFQHLAALGIRLTGRFVPGC